MSFINSINKKEDTILLEKYDGEDLQINNDIDLTPIDKNSDIMSVEELSSWIIENKDSIGKI